VSAKNGESRRWTGEKKVTLREGGTVIIHPLEQDCESQEKMVSEGVQKDVSSPTLAGGTEHQIWRGEEKDVGGKKEKREKILLAEKKKEGRIHLRTIRRHLKKRTDTLHNKY